MAAGGQLCEWRHVFLLSSIQIFISTSTHTLYTQRKGIYQPFTIENMDPTNPTPPRRKRGRPPKPKTDAIPHRPRPTTNTPGGEVSSSHAAREQESSGHTPEASTSQPSTSQPPKRGRGRPLGSKNIKRLPMVLAGEGDLDEVAEEEPSAKKVTVSDLSERDRKALEMWIPQGKHKTAQRLSYMELNTAYHRGIAASTEHHKKSPRPMTKERYEGQGMPGCPSPIFDDLWGPEDEQRLIERWDASAENAALNALTRWTEMLSLWKVSLRRFGKDPYP